MPRKPKLGKHKGVYEKVKGSGIWWIRYTKDGKRTTESIGRHGDAVTMYQQRMTELKTGVRLSLQVGRRGVKFQELAEDALLFSRDHHTDQRNFRQRLELAADEFGSRVADSIRPKELGEWLVRTADEREWTAATRNRVKAAVSKALKLGVDNGKVQTNPARFVPAKRENPGRLRFLHEEEEQRLRHVIAVNRPHCMAQLDVALHTGMRRSEQFSVSWDQVDFEQGHIFLEKTKNGSSRYVQLNETCLTTLRGLRDECQAKGIKHQTLFFNQRRTAIKDPREWFWRFLQGGRYTRGHLAHTTSHLLL